jgi:hypothetical protein
MRVRELSRFWRRTVVAWATGGECDVGGRVERLLLGGAEGAETDDRFIPFGSLPGYNGESRGEFVIRPLPFEAVDPDSDARYE